MRSRSCDWCGLWILVAAMRVVAAEPEIVAIRELPNADGFHGAPWVSADGLTLYWKGPPANEKKHWIWSATRKSSEDLFENATKLIPGNDPTVTDDGLEMILLDGDTLFSTTRASRTDAFRRPQKIAELQGLGFLAAPCLSADGLALYAEQIDFKTKTIQVLKFARSTRKSKWSAPQKVVIGGVGKSKVRFVQVSADRRQAFGSIQSEGEQFHVTVWRVDETGLNFDSPRAVQFEGQSLRGKFARYVPATKELFLARARPDNKTDELIILRNFEPGALAPR